MKQILIALFIGLLLIPTSSQAKSTDISSSSLDKKQEISELKKQIKVLQTNLSVLQKELKKEKKVSNSSRSKTETAKLVSEKENILKEQISLRDYLDSCTSASCNFLPSLTRNEDLNKRLNEIDKLLGTSSFTCSYKLWGANRPLRSCGN